MNHFYWCAYKIRFRLNEMRMQKMTWQMKALSTKSLAKIDAHICLLGDYVFGPMQVSLE